MFGIWQDYFNQESLTLELKEKSRGGQRALSHHFPLSVELQFWCGIKSEKPVEKMVRNEGAVPL